MNEDSLNELGEHISANMAQAVVSFVVVREELTVFAKADQISSLLKFLRDDGACRFLLLVDICGVDYPERQHRFDVVYHLLSMHQNQRVRVKVETDEDVPVPSVCDVFPVANWFEREAYDMYGILFSDHPDLRRLLTDYGFDSHPLRKDFPVTGYQEVRYDDDQKRVIYEPVKLPQEFRKFDFMSPWEGAQYILPGDKKSNNDGTKDA
jgi:NADH-quinone oxidoreductase subunit C